MDVQAQFMGKLKNYHFCFILCLFFRTPSLYSTHLVNRNHHRPTYQLDPYSTYLPPVTYSSTTGIPPPPPPVTAVLSSISSVSTSSASNIIDGHQLHGSHELAPSSVGSTSTISASIAAVAKQEFPSLLVNDRSQQHQSSSIHQNQHNLQHHCHPQIQQQHQQVVLSTSNKNKEKIEGKVQLVNISTGYNTVTSNVKTVGFKVPSGKEGSLKHRILTRPYGEKDIKHRSSSIHGGVVRFVFVHFFHFIHKFQK